ncbi:uncharacterized protein LOC135846609 [Planococcus citri]|uniref:uncharacterized protein LOC135846609 n=1 Tax=Planococcus citri TaxID=170843 RepID=UPI0031F8BD75
MNNMKTKHLGFLPFCLYFSMAIITVSADDFNLQNGKTTIIKVLTSLYKAVSKENIPNFQSITDATDFDGMSNAAEAFLFPEKVEEIKQVARRYVKPILGITARYLLNFRKELEAHEDTKNKTTPMSSQLEGIRQYFHQQAKAEADAEARTDAEIDAKLMSSDSSTK